MGVQTNKKYRQGYEITETIVDGDIFKITEEYKDDEGNVVIFTSTTQQQEN